MSELKCLVCKIELTESEAYEYRGAIACVAHHDEVIAKRNFQRQEIMEEENRKTKVFKGLDLSDSPIGKANREILKPQIEIASKESGRLKDYEGRSK